MLRLEKVSKYYFSGNNVVLALRRINLDFKLGEFVAITGESGSGKSTLLNVLSGLDTYEEGKVFFNDEDISHYTVQELEHYRKDYIGYVFQEYNIINSYTVYQNVELALTIQGIEKEEKHKRVLELIEQVGLSHVTYQKASKLSGGEKQRTVIARTLAKDYQILVCDEPTGNLNKEASHGIFKLLKEISKDKLVIVVTHDNALLEQYATRKVHLYDGEIMEDTQLEKTKKISEDISPKKTNTSIWGSLKIAFLNVLTVPKKSLFALVTIIFLFAMVFFIYSASLYEINKPFDATNPYFSNSDASRVVLIKDDNTKFTQDEIDEINSLSLVRGVFENDIVFDSEFITKIYNEATEEFDFYNFKPLPALSLDAYDILEGRFPQNENEVVIGDNGVFNIGDEIDIANNYLLMETQELDTDQYTFTVVGIMDEPASVRNDLHYFYLSNEGLARISSSSIYENSEVSMKFYGTQKYDMATDTWITPDVDDTVSIGLRTYEVSYPIWIKIDDSIADNEIQTFNMMYFEICRDFGYKKEVRDDMEAGLCDATAFIENHDISFRAVTRYENDIEFLPITITSTTYTDTDQSLKLYMNETTYNLFFNDAYYQITAIVKDAYDGNQVVEKLESMGYNVFYPSELISESQAASIVIHNLLTTVVAAVIIFVVFFVGYFVLRNIIFSKQKEYLIIRSLGTPKNAIRHILRFEVFMLGIIALIILFVVIFIAEQTILDHLNILRFYKPVDYIILGVLIAFVMEYMAYRFTKQIFEASVIIALKGVES